MKKVTGYIECRPIGCYDYEFYVEDDATEKEIEEKIEEYCQLSMWHTVEEGYIAEQQTVYRKKYDWED